MRGRWGEIFILCCVQKPREAKSSARRQHFDTLSDQAEGKKAFTVSV
jgi:hypothetical protein